MDVGRLARPPGPALLAAHELGPNDTEPVIAGALGEADPGVMLPVLVHLTGDDEWLSGRYREMAAGLRADPPVPADPELAARICEQALRSLVKLRDGRHRMPPPPAAEILLDMMSAVTGENPGRTYLPKLMEDIGLVSRPGWQPGGAGRQDLSVIVLGAGHGGLHAAMELRKAGFPFRVIEKNDRVGGTWLENVYPECGVDTQSHLYTYSQHPNAEWTRFFPRRQEILAYIERCAETAGIMDRISFGTEALSARFDAGTSKWSVEVRHSDGTTDMISAKVLITAAGALNRPKYPAIADLDRFAGPAFHTARWRTDVDLTGRRVALIGNGSSGVQVARSIAAAAASLTCFQRSPHWVTHNPDTYRSVGAGLRWVLGHVPFYWEWYRFLLYWTIGDSMYSNIQVDPNWTGPGISATNERVRIRLEQHIRAELAGREDLIRAVTPRYPPYTKRMVVDNDWYKTLVRPNVRLVTQSIEAATPTGLVTSDGRHHDLDVLVFATGFHNTRLLFPVEVRGRSGRTIAETAGHDDDARAFLGTTIPDFPNLFILNGPNTGLGHGGSGIYIAECQVRYILSALTQMADRGIIEAEVRPDVCDDYNRRIEAGLKGMVWSHTDIQSRYRNDAGRVIANHPWRLQEFWLLTARADLAHYRLKTGCDRGG